LLVGVGGGGTMRGGVHVHVVGIVKVMSCHYVSYPAWGVLLEAGSSLRGVQLCIVVEER